MIDRFNRTLKAEDRQTPLLVAKYNSCPDSAYGSIACEKKTKFQSEESAKQ